MFLQCVRIEPHQSILTMYKIRQSTFVTPSRLVSEKNKEKKIMAIAKFISLHVIPFSIIPFSSILLLVIMRKQMLGFHNIAFLTHRFHQIFNKNDVTISYTCMANMSTMKKTVN